MPSFDHASPGLLVTLSRAAGASARSAGATFACWRCIRNRSKASRTTRASSSLTRSFFVLHRVAVGTGPPVHFPLATGAGDLSRVRSLIISRSNSAKDINMFIVSRPIASAVEKFCVTETNEAPAARGAPSPSRSRGASARRSTFVDDDDVDLPASTSAIRRVNAGRSMFAPVKPPSS